MRVAHLLALMCMAQAIVGCRSCRKESVTTSAGGDDSCVPATGAARRIELDDDRGYTQDFVSDGQHLYAIELLPGNPTKDNSYHVTRIALRGGQHTRVSGPAPQIYAPMLVTGSVLVVQSSVFSRERYPQPALINHDLTTGRETPVHYPPGIEPSLQVQSLHANPDGQVTAVAHEKGDAIVFRWNPATDAPATLLERVRRAPEVDSASLEPLTFDGSKFMVLRHTTSRPHRVAPLPQSTMLEVTAPPDFQMIGAAAGRAYVVKFDGWTGSGEESAPTKAELAVVDKHGLRVISRDPFLPASATVHGGHFYGLRRSGNLAVVRFRRRIDDANVGSEEILEPLASSASFTFDACSVMWEVQGADLLVRKVQPSIMRAPIR